MQKDFWQSHVIETGTPTNPNRIAKGSVVVPLKSTAFNWEIEKVSQIQLSSAVQEIVFGLLPDTGKD